MLEIASHTVHSPPPGSLPHSSITREPLRTQTRVRFGVRVVLRLEYLMFCFSIHRKASGSSAWIPDARAWRMQLLPLRSACSRRGETQHEFKNTNKAQGWLQSWVLLMGSGGHGNPSHDQVLQPAGHVLRHLRLQQVPLRLQVPLVPPQHLLRPEEEPGLRLQGGRWVQRSTLSFWMHHKKQWIRFPIQRGRV